MKKVFLDLETTGVTPGKHGVIEIGAIIEANGEEKRFAHRVKPFSTDEIDDSALEIQGVSRESIQAFPEPPEVYLRFIRFLDMIVNKYDRKDKAFLIGYNVTFDQSHLRAWFEKNGNQYFGSYFWFPAIDVAILAAHYLGEKRDELPDFKLGTVCRHFGIDLENAHTAAADIEATRELYYRLIDLQNGPPPKEFIQTELFNG